MDEGGRSMVVLDTAGTAGKSGTLRGVRAVGGEEVGRWMGGWGFGSGGGGRGGGGEAPLQG